MTIDTPRSLEFRLLGPLEVRNNGDVLPLGGRKQRALLAVLLLRANEVVSTQRLIDELWGGNPPASARHSVEVYVSRLRKLLRADGEPQILVTRAAGYIANVDPAHLDAHQFDELRREGQHALAAGEPERASDRLAAALSLWRGAPLAELELEGTTGTELSRLEEVHLAAHEDWVDAELALGRHAEVGGELRTLVQAHPFRERVRRQLMLALYRSGRQAEALEVYREVHARFVEELGIEPGQELRDLERRILSQDPTLARTEHPTASASPGSDKPLPGTTVASNLPTPASSFVGRELEVEAVLAEIANGARLVTLTGPGGSGKTRLAIEVATALVPDYEAGVYWVPLSALRDPSLVTETISRTLGARNGLADHIGERQMLVLLDNLEQVVEAAPELSPVLQCCPNLTMLVTSRELLRIDGEVMFSVPPLANPEGIALFCERARVAPDAHISTLCSRLDNLPLAIELAAAREKALSPAQILDRLTARLDLLQGGRDADPRQRTLRATIEWSYDLLSPEEQRLFAQLAIFRGGCELEAAAHVCDAHVDTLLSLVEKNLVLFSNERYWMLETIREYAGERVRELPEYESLCDRHSDYFFALAQTAEPKLEAADQISWLNRLATELDNIRMALDWAQTMGRAEDALRAAIALRQLWNVRVNPGEVRRRFEVLLSVEQPPALRVLGLRGIGQAAILQGDHERAWTLAEERLALYRALNDDVGIHRTMQGLAVSAGELGDLDQARALITPVVAWARGVSDYELTYPLDTLAEIAFGERNYDESLAASTEALAIYKQLGDDLGIAGACGRIGEIHLYTGRLEEAMPWLTRSLELWRDLGDLGALGAHMASIALVAYMCGEARRAALLLGKADRLIEDVGRRLTAYSDSPHERASTSVIDALGAGHFEAAYAEGRELPLDDAIQIARAVLGDE